ncbi:zinc finger protein CONSTANS-LIKE 7 isoform X2 [Benincasa hispida]|uniref:zinc finger protein CONSTANS-LIKE 7 isoform X2 n=1 Tax=Benincasa hispida TaxID=102211 RepID=UPI001900A442|nr:zinc finger protein CONSTANS-LIKE 7 isoform X2 [Benincasa hispida]
MEEREMGFSWLVKSPKKEDEQQVPNSIWEDDFKAFFELTDEENPPRPPLQQPDYHFHDGAFMENKNKISLNLNLNYEEVLEAWSDRGSLWAAAASSLTDDATHDPYMGEVPRMEEERTRRVLRYKEKRHTRLFSKKIRYQVRKLNAEKRPRIKNFFCGFHCRGPLQTKTQQLAIKDTL